MIDNLELEENVREIVIKLIKDQLDLREEEATEIITDHSSLIEGGFIDSMSFILLIEMCQMRFGVFFNTSDISIEDWDSIQQISNSIKKVLKDNDI